MHHTKNLRLCLVWTTKKWFNGGSKLFLAKIKYDNNKKILNKFFVPPNLILIKMTHV
jgi:hypothetical protein